MKGPNSDSRTRLHNDLNGSRANGLTGRTHHHLHPRTGAAQRHMGFTGIDGLLLGVALGAVFLILIAALCVNLR